MLAVVGGRFGELLCSDDRQGGLVRSRDMVVEE